MALSQDSTVRIVNKIITLGEIRELVEATESWGSATLVNIEAPEGGPKVIELKFGDILR